MSHLIVKQMTVKSSIHISISSLSVTLHKPSKPRQWETPRHWRSHCFLKTQRGHKVSPSMVIALPTENHEKPRGKPAPSHWNHRSRKPLQWFWRHCLFWRQRNIANSLAKEGSLGPTSFQNKHPSPELFQPHVEVDLVVGRSEKFHVPQDLYLRRPLIEFQAAVTWRGSD